MKTSRIFIYALSVVLIIAGYNFLGCKRPAKPKASVLVVDEEDKPVENALVVVRADSGRVIYLASGMKLADSVYTDASGSISYEFLYEAIYNVKCSKRDKKNPSKDMCGSGVLILKENETYNEKIKIRLGNCINY